MKRIILAVTFLLIYASFSSLNAQWARIYGGSGIGTAHAIQQTSDGGFIFSGSYNGAGNYDDIWILKLSSDGEIEWQKIYVSPRLNELAGANSIQQTSDGGYIVAGVTASFGAGEGDFWVLKLSPEGDVEWQKTYGGGGYDSAYFIQQTRDGGYIVAGVTASFGAGESDIWFLKLSPEGDVEWQKTYGGDKSDSSSIQQTRDGGYMVLGYIRYYEDEEWVSDNWFLKLSSEGDVEWQKTYVSPGLNNQAEANAIHQTSDGGYLVAGRTGYYEGEFSDIWILKLSSDGDIEWQKTYIGAESDWASLIQQTSDGGYIITGSAQHYYDWSKYEGNIWILKLSLTGAIEWQRTYEGSSALSASLIKQTSDGGYIVTGRSESFGDNWNNSDLLIMKLSSNGDIEWEKTYGGDYSSDGASFIQQTSDQGYIVAGETGSWSTGHLWILKLLPNGDINPRCAFIKSSNAEVSDIDIMAEDINMTPEDADITSKDTNITPQDSDIAAQNSDANLYDLCSVTCTLTLSTNSGGTTDPAPGTHTYETGSKVTLKALPEGDYTFSYWLGNISCSISPITITMDGNKYITATFYEPQPWEWGGGDQEGGCFIAEAAYCSPLHPFVKILRDFRDRYLMPNKLGLALTRIYYKYSPFVANLVAKHKVLKVAVRISLLPLITISYLILHFGPAITAAMLGLIFMLPVFLVLLYRRRLRYHRVKTR